MTEDNIPYRTRLNLIRQGLAEKTTGAKPKKFIPKVSKKKLLADKALKDAGGDNEMDLFFGRMRGKMVGVCQCGCGKPSQKKDDTFFRNCICHIFPKRIFKSIATNELNWVERAFFGGCHSNMDNKSMDLWVNFADWDDIKEKFYQLAPMLTEDERKTKFYTHLEKLVYSKK